MKSFAAVSLALLLASASAFTAPSMATRAVGNPFAKKKVEKKAAPAVSFTWTCMSFENNLLVPMT